jgi:hypothetical protein
MKAQKLAVFQKSSCRKIPITLTDHVGQFSKSEIDSMTMSAPVPE